MKTLKIVPLSPNVIPQYATEGSAGLDLTADIGKDITINPGECVVIPSGIKIAVPKNCVGCLYPRSGLSTKHGIIIANTVGIIDSDYRGEVKLPLKNTGNTPYTVKPNERVAQLIIQPYEKCTIEITKELESTERGEGGFGSTGK